MKLSDADCALIVADASNLSERFSGDFAPAQGHDSKAGARRLSRWKQLAAGNDDKRFAEMLGIWGIEQTPDAELIAMLGPVIRERSLPPAPWIGLLNEIVETVARTFTGHKVSHRSERTKRKGRRIPFEHLYQPIVQLAQNRVDESHPVAIGFLGAHAKRGLQQLLLQRISSVASKVLYTMFLAHKAFDSSNLMQHLFATAASKSRVADSSCQYAGFVVEQGEDGLGSFFVRYPVVARLIAELTQQWIDFVGEFLQRLENDRSAMDVAFNTQLSGGCVRAVQAGISDPHHGGRSVLILTFGDGQRVVYKPRAMLVDQIFFDLVGAINGHGTTPDLRVLKVLDLGAYGWMEFAQHESCSDKRAARRYYQRAGALAGLIHWLQGIDFHRENVVAAGEHPVLVDLESLAHPLRPFELPDGGSRSTTFYGNSVLRTGLLPLWQPRFDSLSLYDNCGFAGPTAQRSLLSTMRMTDVNTDRMQLIRGVRKQHHAAHRPVLKKRLLSISSYESEVLSGYQMMCRLLEGTHAREFFNWHLQICATERRWIKRPTFAYGMALRRSLEPQCLASGVDRSMELLRLPSDHPNADSWVAEIASLEKLDIPYFKIGSLTEEVVDSKQELTPPSQLAEQGQAVSLAVRHRQALDAGRICEVAALRKTLALGRR